jgi:lysophospholipase L1-like esterase
MLAPLIAIAAVLLGVPAAEAITERAISKRAYVVGDSLAVGTQPYIPGFLHGWSVQQTASISRHAPEGPSILRSYGRGLPRVLVMSLGTNDDPNAVSAFRQAIRDTMRVAGPRRCVVWVNIVRPPVGGTTYAGYNSALATESKPRANLRVVNWAKIASRHPEWFGGDGVHPDATGYRERARVIARAVNNCR